MFQITTDVLSLTQLQREALAEFIVSFPATKVVDNYFAPLEDEEEPVTIQAFTVTDEELDASFVTAEDTAAAIARYVARIETTAFPPAPPAPPAPEPIVYGANLDSKGLPWDERIHASSKAKVADGSWRQKRNVDPSLVTAVEAELKALMGIPAPGGTISVGEANKVLVSAGLPSIPTPVARIETTVVPPAPLVDVIAPFIPSPPVNLTVVPQAKHCAAHDQWYLEACSKCLQVVPTPPAPPAPAPVPDTNAFAALVVMSRAAIDGKKLTLEELNAACIALGVPSLGLLNNRLDLVPQVKASVEALIATR